MLAFTIFFVKALHLLNRWAESLNLGESVLFVLRSCLSLSQILNSPSSFELRASS
jgi:hypothetical protein